MHDMPGWLQEVYTHCLHSKDKALVQVPIPVQVYEINGRMSWPIHRWLFVIVSLFVFKGMVTVMPRLQISKLFMTSFYMHGKFRDKIYLPSALVCMCEDRCPTACE